ncbi:MAG: N-6 DNA methylase [Bacteroidota bacterium]|nr:N-6 DNA methylase [Bacteroidota bacterium]
MTYFEDYFKALQNTPIDQITEHSHRTQLENLLNAIVQTHKLKIKILHEPKREEKFGAPDFKITSSESIVGYVENKKIEELLDKTLKTDQLKKYKELSQNILLTNYIDFIWIKGEEIKREQLCYLNGVENRKSVLQPDRIKAVETLIQNFFSQAPQQIDNPKKLAHALAIRAKWLKAFLKDELERQHNENDEGTLSGLYETFKTYIFHELTLDEFADAFSQNLVYGLFLASLNAGVKKVDLYNAKQFIPGSFELIKELVNFLDELEKPEYKETKWIIEEVLTILNNMAKEALERKLFYRSTKKEDLWGDKEYDFKDPFIYFYEDFLAAYDKNLRKAKGVYYTPPPIVNFIVRAIDDIIINTLGYREGLADMEKVTVLDFATGTGTFLLEICKQIFSKVPRDSAKKKLLVKEHILKNLFGFEYLIAPYTIAHLKLSQFLKDEGYIMQGDERLNVFLTNTLEPAEKNIRIPLLPALSEETNEAQKIKDKKILVITGNPPYSGHSKNPSEHKVFLKKGDTYNKKYRWNTTTNKIEPIPAKASKDGWYTVKTDIGQKLMEYFFVDGMPLGERNPKWLQDDYVKFIRFAQDKMDKVDEGIVGIITNHRFLSNPTFPGMRQSLLNSFNQIYILDLHGSNKPKENSPDNSIDENVFDEIQQGVSINLFVKKSGLERNIFYSEIWGRRSFKYDSCWEQEISKTPWQKVSPTSPFYFFKPQDVTSKAEYEKGWKIKDIFKLFGNGIVTKRDKLVVDVSKVELIRKLNFFKDENKTDEEIKKYFNVPLIDKDKWNLKKARNHLQTTGVIENNIVPIYYRPFDLEYIYSDNILVARLVKLTMKNFIEKNLGIILGRAGQNVKGNSWELILATSNPIDLNIFARGGGTAFPLYLFNNNSKEANLSISFIEYFKNLYQISFTPEQILGYIYAILHSSRYRTKYSEFLKMDFPRIPFTPDKKIFEELSDLGWQLIQAHLLNHADVKNHAGIDFKGIGNEIVDKAVWNSGKLFINKTQWFEPVTKEVYEFYIGGYQVLDKYLKDRKGRSIQKEIYHICYIIQSLQFTINQMKIIDTKTSSWI